MLKQIASRLDTLYPDRETRRRARALWTVLLIAGVGNVLYFLSLLPGLLQRTAPNPLSTIVSIVILLTIVVVCFVLLLNGKRHLGAWALSVGVWLVSIISLMPVGVFDIEIIKIPLSIVLVGFVLNWQETLIYSGLYCVSVLALGLLQAGGVSPLPPLAVDDNLVFGLGTALTATATTGVMVTLLARQLALAVDETEQQANKLQATVEVGELITSILNPEEMLRAVAERIREEFGVYHAQVFLLDERGSRVVLRASTGLAGRDLLARSHSLQVGSGSIVGKATVSRKPVIGEEIESQRQDDPLHDTQSEAALPMMVGTKLVGVLDVHSTDPHAFTEEDVGALQTLANQIALALEGTQSIISEGQALDTTSPVFRATREIAAADDPQVIVQAMRRHVSGNLDRISIVGVGFGPGGEPAPEVVATWDRANVAMNADFPEEVRRIVGSQQMIIPDTSLIETDQSRLRNYAEITLLAGSIAIFPLAGRDRTSGYLILASRSTRVYSEREIQVFQILADQIATVLENQSLLETLSRRTEQLTQINRMAQIMAGTLDLGELGESVISTLEGTVDVVHLSIALYDPNRPFVHLGIMRGASNGDEPSREIRLEGTLIEQALHTGQPVVVDSMSGRHDGAQWMKEQAQVLMVIPLRAHGQYLGTLNIGASQMQDFDHETVAMCEQVAVQFAIALDNVRLFDQLESSLEEARMLYNTSLAISSAHSLGEVCTTLLTEVGRISQAERVRFYLAGPDPRGEIEYLEEVAYWVDGDVLMPASLTRHPANEVPVLSQFLRSQGNLLFEPVMHDMRLNQEDRRYYEEQDVSGLGIIPLNTGATWLGALMIELTDERSLTPNQLRLCRNITDQAALVVDSQVLLTRTQRIATREQALREITNRLRSAPNAEAVLQIAVEELSLALDLPKGAAQLGYPSGRSRAEDGQPEQG